MTRTAVLCLTLAAAACGRGSEPEPVRAPAVDTMVSTGDHRLHLRVRRGVGPVTVIFEAGGAADMASWASVPDSLANRSDASVVAYDRAGLGSSELGPLDLAPEDEVRAFHRALDALDLPRPTIVVGHSYGAMMALLHAELFPNKVEALVLVDPMNPRFVAAVGDWLATTVPDIPDPASNRDHAVLRMVRTMDGLSSRLLTVEPRLEQPMWVVSAGRAWWGPEDVDAAWVASHESMVAVAPQRSRSIATDAAHDIPVEDPEAILSAVAAAIERVARRP